MQRSKGLCIFLLRYIQNEILFVKSLVMSFLLGNHLLNCESYNQTTLFEGAILVSTFGNTLTMKNWKPLLLLVLSVTLTPLVYGQNRKARQVAQSQVVSDVTKELLNNEAVKYSFHSNKLLLEDQIESIKDRFKSRYTEINSIEIEITTQQVTIVMDQIHSKDVLKSILNRFNCFEYLIVSEH